MEIDNTYNIVTCITIIIILFGLIKKQSKILFVIQLLWMYILAAGNTLSIDMGVHISIFENAAYGNEIYDFLSVFANSLGLDFIGMNAILCVFSFTLIGYIINKYTNSPCFVASLLYIYPLTEYIIQKRFFTAFSIVLFAVIYFLFKKGWIYKLLFIISIIIAGKIHSATFAYMVLLLTPILENSKRRRFIIILCFIIILSTMPFIPNIMEQFFGAKAILYFEVLHEKVKYPILNTILWTGFHLVFVYLYYRIYLTLKYMKIKDKYFIFAKHIHYLNLCSILFIPLYVWEPTFFRYYRNLLILNYIGISYILPVGQIFLKNILCKICIYVSYVIIAFICIYFFASAGFEAMIYPILFNNYFFDIFRMGI